MEARKMVGVSQLVISRRERAVVLEPRGKGIVLWTLRYGDEVRDEKSYFDGIDNEKPEPDTLSLVRKLIKKQTRDWDAKMVIDPVQDRLLDIIESRKKALKKTSKTKTKKPAVEPPDNVINIMDALRKSLAGEKRSRK
jgi:DNA end-binding protein Ku